MKTPFFILLSSLTILAVGCTATSGEQNPRQFTQYVDPAIGSGGHGHVFVGANVPHGMVQAGPVNVSEGWDWCSGYHISDTTIIGFAQTHLSGTGIGDKGDIQLMPMTDVTVFNNKRSFLSTYNPATEVKQAGYYAVELSKYGIRAEITATERTGFHRYTFPKGKKPQILLNLKQGIGWDWPTNVSATLLNDSTIIGQRLSKGWAAEDRVFYAAHFSKPIQSIQFMSDTTFEQGTRKPRLIIKDCYALISFAPTDTIEAQVAISGVDIQGAQKNLAAETKNVTFEKARAMANQKWNNYLGFVDIEGGTAEQLKTFYTALYHTAFFPALFTDTDGRYRGADGQIYHSKQPRYTVFSLWDTYRALHPLYTLTEPSQTADYVNSMLDIYDQQGKLPVWHLWGNETDCMVGFGSVQVIADAILKDLKGFDYKRAYEAMRSYAALNERGLEQVREQGFIAADSETESVAKALEYCISDYAIAQVALKLGYKDDFEIFTERSKNYKKYFDPSDHFIKGLLEPTIRRSPFDPAHSTHREDDFCEGNSWQYSWMIPHDIDGLIALFPSRNDAEEKLDSLFNTPFVANEGISPDISGMIGQYAHGNEPSHSTIYAYVNLGKPEKMAALARGIMDSLYHASPDGLSGNEDCGQMSAWYVLNAIGLYQSNPAGGEFVIGSPLFPSVTMNLPNGKSFTIIAKGFSTANPYHRTAFLNGNVYDRPSISYRDIMAGGTLELLAE